MAIITNGISTEGEAKSKIGSTSSVEANKAILKYRVYDIGGFVINEKNYAYNQCVKYADISVGTQMHTYNLHDNLTVPYTVERSSNPLTYRDDCVRTSYSSYTELYNAWNNYDTTYKFEYNKFPYSPKTFTPSPTISQSIFNYELLLFSGYTDQNKFGIFLSEYPTFLGQTESDINDPVSMEFNNFNYAALGLLNIYADDQGGMLFNDYDGASFNKGIGVNMKCAQEFSIIFRTGINDNHEEAHNRNSVISIFFLIDDPDNGTLKYIKYDLNLDMFSDGTSHADVSDVIYLAYNSDLNNIYVTTDYNNPLTICKISYGQSFMPGGYYPPGSIDFVFPFYKIILKFTKIKQKYNNAKIRNYYITDIYIPHNTKDPAHGLIKLLYDYANYYKLCNSQMHVQPADNKDGYGPLDTCAMYNIGMIKGFDFKDSFDLDKWFDNRIISKQDSIEIIEQKYNSGTAYDTTGFGIINADYCVPNDTNGKRIEVDGSGMYSMSLLTLYYRRAPVLIDWSNKIMGQDDENYSMYPYESLLKVDNDYWKMMAGDLNPSLVGINFDPIMVEKALSAAFEKFTLRENVPYILFPFADLNDATKVIGTWIKYTGVELKVDFKDLLIEFGNNKHGYFVGIPEYLFFMIDGQPLNALTAVSSPACIQVALRLTNFLHVYSDVSKIKYPEYMYVYYKTYFYKYILH